MDILVIGGSGFLGSTLSKKLMESGHNVCGTFRSHKYQDFVYLDVFMKFQFNNF